MIVRESDERWWRSWQGFMKQEIERFEFGGLNLGAIFNEGTDVNLSTVWMSDRPRMVLASRMKASKYGYMGPELKAMFQVRSIVCSRYLRNVALLCASDGNKFYKHCLSNMSLFSNLSPSQKVSNIRHQHRCSLFSRY